MNTFTEGKKQLYILNMKQYRMGNINNNLIPYTAASHGTVYTDIDDTQLNQCHKQIQNGGGIGKFIKKKNRKLDLATSFSKTKKKKILQHQRNNSSATDSKLYTYRALEKTLPEYTKIKAKIKEAKRTGANSKYITSLKEKKKALKTYIRKLGELGEYGNIDVSKLTKKIQTGIFKYEVQQKYYEETGQKLKDDAVNYIQKQSEYKNVQPELKTKLSALSTFDPAKIAVIRIPGQAPKAVNKLKYSDFNVDKPELANVYLKQFKGVNASISKINSEFNIDHLSPERRIELARELHKITVDGIYDPNAQETHFLNAVTDIAYKDKYYNALDVKSKGASVEYLKVQGSFAKVEDPPERNLKQQRNLLANRLSTSTEAEQVKIQEEIKHLDTQLSTSPSDIDTRKRILSGQLSVLTPVNPKYQELQDELIRLDIQKADIGATKLATDTADTQLVTQKISELKRALDKRDIDENRSALDELEAKLEEPDITDKQRERRTASKERITKFITDYENTERELNAYRELLPQTRDNFIKKIANYNSDALRAQYYSLIQKRDSIPDINSKPELVRLYNAEIQTLNNMMRGKELQEYVSRDTDLTPKKRALLLSQVTLGMSPDKISELREKIKVDRSINLLNVAQRTAEKKKSAEADILKANSDIIKAKMAERKKGVISGLKAKVIDSAAVKDAKTRKRVFTAEVKGLNAGQKIYSEAMKKKIAPGQELIRTKYGDVRFGNKARKVSNLGNARLLQSDYAGTDPKNVKRGEQLKILQKAINTGTLSSSTAKRLLAERDKGIGANVAGIISDIQTRKVANRITNLPKNKKIKVGKLFKALNALPPNEQYDILSKYSNYYEQKYNNFGKLNISDNKAKYAHIGDKLAIRLNKLVNEHPELKPKDNPVTGAVPNKSNDRREYTRISVATEPVKPVRYELASQEPVKPVKPVVYESASQEPVKPVEYGTVSPNQIPEIYANFSLQGQKESPYNVPRPVQLNPVQLNTKGQGLAVPSANTLQMAIARLKPVTKKSNHK
jgi:hypothetical protein